MRKTPKDLRYQVFGKLTVLTRLMNGDKYDIRWWCLCRCNNWYVANPYRLIKGTCRSCGCLPGNKTDLDKLIGQKIGKLTILTRLTNDRDRRMRFWAYCECGKWCIINTHYLQKSDLPSCGCNNGYNELPETILYQKFGRLTPVTRVSSSKQGKMRYGCVCDCGNWKIVEGGSLRRGTIQSCRCYNKEVVSKNNQRDYTGEIRRGCRLIERLRICVGNIIKTKYRALCICGNTVILDGQNLTKKGIVRCGCQYKYKNIPLGLSGSRNGPDYKAWTKNVKRRDKYRCRVCDMHSKNCHAHHLEAFRLRPELYIEITNGITLCRCCHIMFHSQYGHVTDTEQFLEFYLKYRGKIYWKEL